MNDDGAARAADAQHPVFVPETLAELEETFGRPRLLRLLSGLREEIARRLGAGVTSPEAISRDAHALVSASGTLGFARLSEACAALERACASDANDTVEALARVRTAAREAVTAIDDIQRT
ncbi:Hpt domain-containing protein [Methylobacterium sp. A54F]